MSFKKVIYENYFFTKKCYYLLHLYYKLLYYHRSTLGQFSSARVTNFQKLFFSLENANFNRITRCTKINSANFCSNLTKKNSFSIFMHGKICQFSVFEKKILLKSFWHKKVCRSTDGIYALPFRHRKMC